jgi:hypothetical protein
MRYSVGDKVDASRAENGENHERGVVIDSYELIIGEVRKPMVVVEFEDGERQYMTAATPNVLPVYEEDEEEAVESAEPEAEAEPEVDAEAEPDGEEPNPEDAVLYIDEDEGASP